MGGLRLHITNGSVAFYICESSTCDYKQIDDAYSWKHAIHEKKWTARKAILINGKKASGKNMELVSNYRENENVDLDNVQTELYCPKCSKNTPSQ